MDLLVKQTQIVHGLSFFGQLWALQNRTPGKRRTHTLFFSSSSFSSSSFLCHHHPHRHCRWRTGSCPSSTACGNREQWHFFLGKKKPFDPRSWPQLFAYLQVFRAASRRSLLHLYFGHLFGFRSLSGGLRAARRLQTRWLCVSIRSCAGQSKRC